MNINTGGSAFPIETSTAFQHPGMTLRDYFAAKAMQGLLACHDINGDFDDFAKNSYGFADAMLKAREQ